MSITNVPQVLLVPFGYPDYPQELLRRFLSLSEKALQEAGLAVRSVEPVIERNDVARAVRQISCCIDYDVIVALLLSWVEAPNFVAVLQDFFHRPLVLWSHTTFMENGKRFTLGPLPAAGVLRETLEEMRVNFQFVFGHPEEPSVRKEIVRYSKAAFAVRRLRKSRIGLLGYASMGMYTGTFDHVKVRTRLGPEVDHLDQYLLVKEIENFSAGDVQEMVEQAKANWDLSLAVTNEDLVLTMKVFRALEEIVRERDHDALTVKCQYELSRLYGMAPCVALSLLGDRMPVSCEGDVLLAVSQLLLHSLTGEVVSYGDVHDLVDNGIVLGACGFAPLSLAACRPVIDKHSALYQGLLNSSPYKDGPVTLVRLASDGDGFKMHVAVGEAQSPPAFQEVGCPPYPCVRVNLRGNAREFILRLMSQHYGFVYGDVQAELMDVAKILGIRVVMAE